MEMLHSEQLHTTMTHRTELCEHIKLRRRPTFQQNGHERCRFTVARLVHAELNVLQNARHQVAPADDAVPYIFTDLFFADTKRLHTYATDKYSLPRAANQSATRQQSESTIELCSK